MQQETTSTASTAVGTAVMVVPVLHQEFVNETARTLIKDTASY